MIDHIPSSADSVTAKECPWEALRAELLHGLDGFDNDQINAVLAEIARSPVSGQACEARDAALDEAASALCALARRFTSDYTMAVTDAVNTVRALKSVQGKASDAEDAARWRAWRAATASSDDLFIEKAYALFPAAVRIGIRNPTEDETDAAFDAARAQQQGGSNND